MTDIASIMPGDAGNAPGPSADPALRKRSHTGRLALIDSIAQKTALGGALCMSALLLMLICVVGHGAWPAMRKFGLAFLWHSEWSAARGQFGALTLIVGTLLTAMIALLISIPVSVGSAIFLTKLAPKLRIPLPNFRKNSNSQFTWMSPRHVVTVVSFLIELLAAIPSIAYGLWGIFVLVPFMQSSVQPALGNSLGRLPGIGQFFADAGYGGYNILTAGLILSIMVTPIMTAIIRDVLTVTPPELEQGALGLGATWWQATRLVLGFSKMGILGAVILGFARAIGETMAVTMVIGNSSQMPESLTSPGYTIASILANQFNNADTDAEKQALIYAAFVLLLITTLINGIARVMVMRSAAKARRR
jgi:phosphate transport system permease protein